MATNTLENSTESPARVSCVRASQVGTRGGMDAKAIYDYAAKYAAKSEAAGRGTQWPTIRQAARRFKRKIADVKDCVESSDPSEVGGEYFAIAVGFGISGAGYGSASFDSDGDCQIEAY